MALDLVCWLGVVNLLLFIRVLRSTPRAMEMTAGANHLRQQAALIWAEVEQEKVNRNITDTDFMREQRLRFEAMVELERIKRRQPSCDTAEQS